MRVEQSTKYKEFEAILKAGPAASFATVAGAAASSGGPGLPRPGLAPHAGSARSQQDEKCNVLVRGFPEDLPKAVLEETLAELIGLMPLHEQSKVRHRIGMVDNKIILIFPTTEGAEGFLDKFRSEAFVYIDKDSQAQSTLVANQGRPLAVRRRGAATHPVYSAAEKVLLRNSALIGAKLTQKPSMRAGSLQTEFYAGLGRKVRSLFTITFAEGEHETTISSVLFPAGGPLSADECQLIREAASVQ